MRIQDEVILRLIYLLASGLDLSDETSNMAPGIAFFCGLLKKGG